MAPHGLLLPILKASAATRNPNRTTTPSSALLRLAAPLLRRGRVALLLPSLTEVAQRHCLDARSNLAATFLEHGTCIVGFEFVPRRG